MLRPYSSAVQRRTKTHQYGSANEYLIASNWIFLFLGSFLLDGLAQQIALRRDDVIVKFFQLPSPAFDDSQENVVRCAGRTFHNTLTRVQPFPDLFIVLILQRAAAGAVRAITFPSRRFSGNRKQTCDGERRSRLLRHEGPCLQGCKSSCGEGLSGLPVCPVKTWTGGGHRTKR